MNGKKTETILSHLWSKRFREKRTKTSERAKLRRFMIMGMKK
jgi:hypothetical protein